MHFSPSYLEARIEVRAAPKGQSLLGTFVYGKIAVVSDRGARAEGAIYGGCVSVRGAR